VRDGVPAADRRLMVNVTIRLIVMGRNGLGRDWQTESHHADGLFADHSTQAIIHSALVIHNLKKHRHYQFMNAPFSKARRSLDGGLKADEKSTPYASSVSVFLLEFSSNSRP
jgi:hypothetical protein